MPLWKWKRNLRYCNICDLFSCESLALLMRCVFHSHIVFFPNVYIIRRRKLHGWRIVFKASRNVSTAFCLAIFCFFLNAVLYINILFSHFYLYWIQFSNVNLDSWSTVGTENVSYKLWKSWNSVVTKSRITRIEIISLCNDKIFFC